MKNLLENSCEPYSYFLNTKKPLSKANPYRDARGRFTSRSRAVINVAGGGSRAAGGSFSGSKTAPKPSTRYHLITDPVRRAAVERKAVEGSSVLLAPRDPVTGVARTLSLAEAKKRYGDTPEKIRQSVEGIIGVKGSVAVSKEFTKSKYAVEEMLGTAQAVEEAKRMGISVNNMKLNFEKVPGDSDGRYSTTLDRAAAQSGIMTMNSRGNRAGEAVDVPSGEFKQVPNTSDAGLIGVKTPSAIAQQGAYAVAIHEIGHHLTIGSLGNSRTTRLLFKNYKGRLPSEYASKHELEMLAEGFSAWWLLGGSKNPTIARYYSQWMPVVTHIIHAEGSGAKSVASGRTEILKNSAAYISKLTEINIDELPPDNPLIVWLTNGASISGTVE